MKVYCCCCARQIVSFVTKPDEYVTTLPATFMGIDKWACSECSKDLDENGLFPEERT